MAEQQMSVIVGADITGFQSAMKTVSDTARDAGKQVSQSMGEVEKSTSKSTSGLKGSLKGMGGSIKESFGKFKGGFKGGFKSLQDFHNQSKRTTGTTGKLAKSIGGIALAMAGISSIGSIVSGAISRIDSIQSGKKTMTLLFDGDASKAKSAVDRTLKIITGTPIALDFAVPEISKAIASGMDDIKATKAFEIAGEASFALKGSDEGIQPIMRAFSQMETGGKITLGHLRALEDQGVPAVKIMANALGVSTQELEKMATGGKLTSEQMETLFTGIMEGSDGVAGSTVAMEGNLQNAGNTIKGVMSNIKSAIISAVAKPFTDNEENYEKLVNGLKKVQGFVKDTFAPAIATAIGAVMEYLPIITDWFRDSFQPIFEKVQEGMEKLFDLIKEDMPDDFSALETLKDVFQWIVDHGELIAGIITAFVIGFTAYKTIMTAVNIVQGIFNALMFANPMGLVVLGIALLIGALVMLYLYWDEVVEFLGGIWDWLAEKASEIFGGIRDFLVGVWDSIKETVIAKWDEIKEWFSEKWLSIKESAIEIWNSITDFFAEWGLTILAVLLGPIAMLALFIYQNWEGIKNKTSEIWNGITTYLSSKWDSIKTTASEKWDSIKNAVAEKIELMKSTISEKIELIKTAISNKWDEIKTNISGKWDEIKSTAGSKWSEIKSTITKPIEETKRTISKIIDDIQGFFRNMKLKLPKITLPKMPKFSMTGKFSLMPPSVPKIGVNWFATGGIATGASIVGIGESGDEAILPLSNKSRMKPFAQAVSSMMEGSPNSGTTIENNFNISQLVIREEADIKRIAKELAREQEKIERAGGRKA